MQQAWDHLAIINRRSLFLSLSRQAPPSSFAARLEGKGWQGRIWAGYVMVFDLSELLAASALPTRETS